MLGTMIIIAELRTTLCDEDRQVMTEVNQHEEIKHDKDNLNNNRDRERERGTQCNYLIPNVTIQE